MPSASPAERKNAQGKGIKERARSKNDRTKKGESENEEERVKRKIAWEENWRRKGKKERFSCERREKRSEIGKNVVGGKRAAEEEEEGANEGWKG